MKKYTKSEKWLSARKVIVYNQRIKNAKRNVAIYKLRKSGVPVLDIQNQFRISATSVHKVIATVQGLIDRKEIDIELFDS